MIFLELLTYTCLATLPALLYAFVVSKQPKPRDSNIHKQMVDNLLAYRSAKRFQPPSESREPIGCWLGIVVLIIPTLLPCFMAVYLFSKALIEDYHTWFLLENNGEMISLPLQNAREIDDKYEVVYEYNGHIRHEKISKDQYRRIKDDSTITVWAYQNTVRVEGWKPRNDMAVVLVLLGIIGSLFLSVIAGDFDTWMRMKANYVFSVDPNFSLIGPIRRRMILAYARLRHWEAPPRAVVKPKRDKVKRKSKNA